ncbi:MAG TPA: cytochrome P450 [Acidimicrobiia bacterium]
MGSGAPTLQVDRSLRRALRRFDEDRLRWLDDAAALGPVAGLRLGPVTAWVVTDPSLARTILIAESARWRRPPALVTPIRVGVGQNLFTQSDRAWEHVQPVLAPVFRAKSLAGSLASLSDVLRDEVRAVPHDVDVDVMALMQRIVLIAASWVLFGERLDRAAADELVVHQRAVVDWVGDRIGRLSGVLPVAIGSEATSMREHRDALREHGNAVLVRARNRSGGSFASALLSTERKASRRSDDELVGQILGMLLAGTETTAAALVWALVHGSANPAEWERIRIDPSQTRSYVFETLRLTPPVWGIPRTPRRAAVHLSTDGVEQRVRRGAVVTIYVRGMNRDPLVWDDPGAFHPARHRDGPAPALIPFGLGPRGCIGQHLALGELLQLLPLLAGHGDVSIASDVVEDPHFALRPDRDVTGRFSCASSPSMPTRVIT